MIYDIRNCCYIIHLNPNIFKMMPANWTSVMHNCIAADHTSKYFICMILPHIRGKHDIIPWKWIHYKKTQSIQHKYVSESHKTYQLEQCNRNFQTYRLLTVHLMIFCRDIWLLFSTEKGKNKIPWSFTKRTLSILKNKLYMKSIKQRHNDDLQKECMKCINKLNHILGIAERKYYNELLHGHINDIKILKAVKTVIDINKSKRKTKQFRQGNKINGNSTEKYPKLSTFFH